MSLRARIYLVLSVLIVTALSSGYVMILYTYRMQGVFDNVMNRYVAANETATYLETAMVNQRGFVTYYFLDGDPKWLRRLEEYRHVFREHLDDAQQLARSVDQREAIQRISDEYSTYVASKDRVIALYKDSHRDEGAELHKAVRQHFFDVLSLCEAYKSQNQEQIHQAYIQVGRTTVNSRYAMVITIAAQMLLVIGLGIFFIHRILAPVYRILLLTTGDVTPSKTENVITALSNRVDHLLQNVDETQHALKKSRENLIQAEKMALVGKLAAGMAHSIRNPFTSVKMRLFSLSRSLTMDTDQEENFEVISQEIRHIDTIVQNFLEFSRPPQLVMQAISLSVIVDNALQLLKHRLNSYSVNVEVVRIRPLPEIIVDPEQLKEVMVNLIINACEKMKNGGSIVIVEQVTGVKFSRMAVVRITDSGPGVPASLRDKIFQPFFTTKEEGTGLGLSIAARIVSKHGGTLTLTDSTHEGSSFSLNLPLKELDNG